MSREKQIEEMWNIITTDCDRECVGCEFENDEWCFTHSVVNKLYNAGYRKIPTTDWLTRGVPQEQIEQEKEDAFKEVAEKLGYRKQEWISVDERLPDNYRTVLVVCKGKTIGCGTLRAIGSYGGGFWSFADADGTLYRTKYMDYTVTHWMPLPEAPKMKGGAE